MTNDSIKFDFCIHEGTDDTYSNINALSLLRETFNMFDEYICLFTRKFKGYTVQIARS